MTYFGIQTLYSNEFSMDPPQLLGKVKKEAFCSLDALWSITSRNLDWFQPFVESFISNILSCYQGHLFMWNALTTKNIFNTAYHTSHNKGVYWWVNFFNVSVFHAIAVHQQFQLFCHINKYWNVCKKKK